jgi:hypothetical protein
VDIEQRTSPLARRLGITMVTVALAVGMVACTGHKKDPSTPTGSASASTGAPAGSVQALQDKVLAAASPSPAIATASASVHLIGSSPQTTDLTAEVVQIAVSGSTTLLHWRLKSTNGSPVSASGNWASGGTSTVTDTSQVALLDTAGKVKLLPYVNAGQAIFGDTDCVCSETPRTVSGTAVDLYGTYPALSANATTVTVAVPGFPAMANVTVTRS